METAIAYLLAKPSETDAQDLLAVIEGVRGDYCTFCTGTGHAPRQCATKKRLDEHFKLTHYGIAWGRVKSKVLRDGMKQRGEALAKRTQADYRTNREVVERSKKTKATSQPMTSNNNAPTGGFRTRT